MSSRGGEKKRPYRMGARAESAAATGERILDAAAEIFYERPVDEINLAAIAARAGVTVQTILRRYGSKAGLFEAAVSRIAMRVAAQRGAAAPGDVEGGVKILVEHYEELGDLVVRMLAEETRQPSLQVMVEMGREYHRQWCERVFAPALEGLTGGRRERRLAQLVAVTDVYVWKVLRRDQGLGPRQTERAMRELVEPLMEPPR